MLDHGQIGNYTQRYIAANIIQAVAWQVKSIATLTFRPAPMHWLHLSIAIISEVIATSALKASAEFTRPLPSLMVVVGYASAFYFLSLTLRVIPLSVTYAIWSGVGIALISLIGYVLYQQSLNMIELLGIALIVAGVVVLNLFSRTLAH